MPAYACRLVCSVVYVHVWMCVYACAFNMCVFASMHVCACAYACKCVLNCACMRVHVCVCLHMCMYVCGRVYVHLSMQLSAN